MNEKQRIMASRFEEIFEGWPTMIVIHICGGSVLKNHPQIDRQKPYFSFMMGITVFFMVSICSWRCVGLLRVGQGWCKSPKWHWRSFVSIRISLSPEQMRWIILDLFAWRVRRFNIRVLSLLWNPRWWTFSTFLKQSPEWTRWYIGSPSWSMAGCSQQNRLASIVKVALLRS